MHIKSFIVHIFHYSSVFKEVWKKKSEVSSVYAPTVLKIGLIFGMFLKFGFILWKICSNLKLVLHPRRKPSDLSGPAKGSLILFFFKFQAKCFFYFIHALLYMYVKHFLVKSNLIWCKKSKFSLNYLGKLHFWLDKLLSVSRSILTETFVRSPFFCACKERSTVSSYRFLILYLISCETITAYNKHYQLISLFFSCIGYDCLSMYLGLTLVLHARLEKKTCTMSLALSGGFFSSAVTQQLMWYGRPVAWQNLAKQDSWKLSLWTEKYIL